MKNPAPSGTGREYSIAIFNSCSIERIVKNRKPPVKSRRGFLEGRHTMDLWPGNGSGRGAAKHPKDRLACIAAAQDVIRDQRFDSYLSLYAFQNGRAICRRSLFIKRRFQSFDRPAELPVAPFPSSEYPFPEQGIDEEQQQVDDPQQDHHDGQNSRFLYHMSFRLYGLNEFSCPEKRRIAGSSSNTGRLAASATIAATPKATASGRRTSKISGKLRRFILSKVL